MSFLSMKIEYVLANSSEPDEMPHYEHFTWVFTVCQIHVSESQVLILKGFIRISLLFKMISLAIRIMLMFMILAHLLFEFSIDNF